jgi:hypothetical protein
MTWNPFKLRTQNARLQKEVAELRIEGSVRVGYVLRLESTLLLKDRLVTSLIHQFLTRMMEAKIAQSGETL